MDCSIQEDSESVESFTSADALSPANTTASPVSDQGLEVIQHTNFFFSHIEPETSDHSSLEIENYSDVPSPRDDNQYNNQRHQAVTEQEKAQLKCAHISNEHVRLTNLLLDLTPRRLVSVLEKKLRKKDSKTIVALSILFPRTEFPASEEFHCVRCHKIFNPEENLDCVVRHPNVAVQRIKEDGNGGTFFCHFCRKSFMLAHMYFYNEHVNAYLAGFCYSGKHTTNPKFVTYRGAVKTCEEQGCVEFYV